MGGFSMSDDIKGVNDAMLGNELVKLVIKDREATKKLMEMFTRQVNEISNKFIEDLEKLMSREGE